MNKPQKDIVDSLSEINSKINIIANKLNQIDNKINSVVSNDNSLNKIDVNSDIISNLSDLIMVSRKFIAGNIYKNRISSVISFIFFASCLGLFLWWLMIKPTSFRF